MWGIAVEEVRGEGLVRSGKVKSAAVRCMAWLNRQQCKARRSQSTVPHLISPCPQYVVTMENLAAAVTLWIASPTSLDNDR